jgi:hypothetical protein
MEVGATAVEGARFRQVGTMDGVDEGIGPHNAGVVVPLGGSNLIYLRDGQHLALKSDQPTKIVVTEIEDVTSHDLIGFLANARVNIAAAVAMTSSGAKRLFRITGHAIVGNHGTFINATNRGTGAIEAKLEVVVLRRKPLKVSLR